MKEDVDVSLDFWPQGDYDSHRPMLYMALNSVPRGTVTELGCGEGSTPSLAKYCKERTRVFRSYETNPEWQAKYPGTILIDDYMKVFDLYGQEDGRLGILFIDSAPGEQRKELLRQWAFMAEVIIIHDTEPGAEYVYGLKETLDSFATRVDLHIAGMPSTTVVSNFIDLNYWKEYTVGGFTLE